MKKHFLLLLLAVFCLLTPRTQAQIYSIDPVHSTVEFKVRHLGISTVTGHFTDFAGTVIFNPDKPEASSVEIIVQAQSVDTGSAKRDTHLKSESFFDAQKFPTLTFKSTAVQKTDPTTYTVTGDLTLHGVTKPVTISFSDLGTAKGMKGETRHGGETELKIKRSDYGMNFMIGPVGDEVKISLAFSGVEQGGQTTQR